MRLLGGAARPPTSRKVTATGTVQQSSAHSWTVRIETQIDGTAGLRVLRGDSCWELASATALLLALAIDPAAAERTVLAEPLVPPPANERPSAPAPPPPASTAPVAESPVRAPGQRSSVRPFVRAFGGAAAGLLPQVAPTGGLAIGLRRDWFDVELSAFVSGDVHAGAPDLAGAGGDFRLLAAASRACARAGSPVLSAGLCAGVELERISATGYGVDSPGSGTAVAAAAVGAAVVSLRVHERLAFSLDVTVAARPYRPAFVLDGVGPVYTLPIVSAFASFGPVLNL